MIEEIWKDIDGFEGLYKVSNLGQIKSLLSNKTFVALGKQFNLNRQTISSIKKHKLWKHVATIAFLSIYSLCSAQDSIWVKIPLRICDTLEFHYQRSLEYQKLAAEYLDLALLWQHKSQGISAALQDKVAEIATMKELQGIDLGEFKREKASLQQQVKDERKLKNRWKWGFWGVVVAAGYIIGKTN